MNTWKSALGLGSCGAAGGAIGSCGGCRGPDALGTGMLQPGDANRPSSSRKADLVTSVTSSSKLAFGPSRGADCGVGMAANPATALASAVEPLAGVSASPKVRRRLSVIPSDVGGLRAPEVGGFPPMVPITRTGEAGVGARAVAAFAGSVAVVEGTSPSNDAYGSLRSGCGGRAFSASPARGCFCAVMVAVDGLVSADSLPNVNRRFSTAVWSSGEGVGAM